MTASITIDGGASRSRARFCSEGKSSTVTGPPLSLTTVDVSTVIARVLALIDQLPHSGANVEVINVGLAGGMNSERVDAVRSALGAKFPAADTTVARDVDLVACQLARPGAATVVGTGVAVIARQARGEVLVDGRGFAIGDRGGGAWIGLEALRRTLRDRDRGGLDSPLLSALLTRLDVDSDRGLAVALCHDGRLDQRRVAALAPTVMALAERGDPDAASVVTDAVDAISESVAWALARVGIVSAAEVVLAGGLAGSGYFCGLLSASLTASDRVEVIRRVDPLNGRLT